MESSFQQSWLVTRVTLHELLFYSETCGIITEDLYLTVVNEHGVEHVA